MFFFSECLNTENLQLKITFEVVLDTSKFGIVWDEYKFETIFVRDQFLTQVSGYFAWFQVFKYISCDL